MLGGWIERLRCRMVCVITSPFIPSIDGARKVECRQRLKERKVELREYQHEVRPTLADPLQYLLPDDFAAIGSHQQ